MSPWSSRSAEKARIHQPRHWCPRRHADVQRIFLDDEQHQVAGFVIVAAVQQAVAEIRHVHVLEENRIRLRRLLAIFLTWQKELRIKKV